MVWRVGAVGLLENEDGGSDREAQAWDRGSGGVGPQGEWVPGQARGNAEALGALRLMIGGIECGGDDVPVPVAKGRIR